ncbi:haloacid dehalogenase type II [Jannaschia seohaensis]|uniref:(S)-2-haloacid dehalogenase n=1 Tax=Jannaschia seohaensis TaxID=475081 RepID=A0A2Y9B851_9RHOB|nr:haloacid dehalogenase type II [Jannaschia seohaensis]PWJ13856.1 2-haloacid dehalogenase [Jannaschia seohaensis]SSA50369.1 2-haloacid dehalogenase [Jannaschia seohaensis]
MKNVDALLFDVFGTIVDWRCGVAEFVSRKIGLVDPYEFADAWRREYQPAMAMVRSGAREYVPLDVLHRENLNKVLATFWVEMAEDERDDLNRAWEQMPPWAASCADLSRLKRQFIIAPCSNGSITMMTRLARYAQLPWDCVLGAGIAKAFKPEPRAYLESVGALGLPAHRVMMVPAHNSDLAAAQAQGLATAFVPRRTEYGFTQATDLEPTGDWDICAESLGELADQLEAMGPKHPLGQTQRDLH